MSVFDSDSVTRTVSNQGTLVNPTKSAFQQASGTLSARSGDTVAISESKLGSTDVTYSSTAGRLNPERLPAAIAAGNPTAQTMRSPSLSVAATLAHSAKTYGPTRYVTTARHDVLEYFQKETTREAIKKEVLAKSDAEREAAERTAMGLPPTTMSVGTPGSSYALALHNVPTFHDAQLNVRSVLQQVYSSEATDGS